MSFSVALAIDNLAGVEEVGHLCLLSPEGVGSVLRRLRGREVSVGKHCASRALALFFLLLRPSSGLCGTQAADGQCAKRTERVNALSGLSGRVSARGLAAHVWS